MKGKTKMRKTVVISPYDKNTSGTLTHCIENGVMRIKLNINTLCNNNFVLRLYALATSKAALKPYLADIYDGCTSSMPETCVSENDVSGSGYSLYDFDTFVITKYCEKNETPAGAAFLGFEWNAAKFLKAETTEKSINPEQPLEKAKNILNVRKTIKNANLTEFYAKEFITNASKHEQLFISGADEYRWYKIPQSTVISSLSSVNHAISNTNGVNAINNSGHYIAGVFKKNIFHIAIGISSPQNNCPMPQLSDCCKYCSGYHITGIFLADDGQYFEKYLQKSDA